MIIVAYRHGRTDAPIILDIDGRIYYTLSVEEAERLSVHLAEAVTRLDGRQHTREPYDHN